MVSFRYVNLICACIFLNPWWEYNKIINYKQVMFVHYCLQRFRKDLRLEWDTFRLFSCIFCLLLFQAFHVKPCMFCSPAPCMFTVNSLIVSVGILPMCIISFTVADTWWTWLNTCMIQIYINCSLIFITEINTKLYKTSVVSDIRRFYTTVVLKLSIVDVKKMQLALICIQYT